MKKSLMLSLITVLVLGAAGITWAAHPAADDAPPAAVEVLEAETASTAIEEAFETENEALAVDLETLLEEPVEVGDCCTIDCMAERRLCKDACFDEPDPEACRAECDQQYDSCVSFC